MSIYIHCKQCYTIITARETKYWRTIMNELFDQKVLDFLSNLEEESFYTYTQNPCEKTKDIHERAKKKLLEYAHKYGIA
jgi:hypothetical protein